MQRLNAAAAARAALQRRRAELRLAAPCGIRSGAELVCFRRCAPARSTWLCAGAALEVRWWLPVERGAAEPATLCRMSVACSN